ncbi:unnamed protein product, partial [Mesorhabditis spiculigera]
MRQPSIHFVPCSQSHPFEERHCIVGDHNDPLKVGRSVARLKPTRDNAVFDCKVLSRSHASIWYSNGSFWIKDTKSSNGTFVNNERLAQTGEDSDPKQIYNGDIIQFGVEIVENANKVSHGCIFSYIRCYNESGHEVAPPTGGEGETANTPGARANFVFQEQMCYALNTHLNEAVYRERHRNEKLAAVVEHLKELEVLSTGTWRSCLLEDVLLRKILTLEDQLETFTSNKAVPEWHTNILNKLEAKDKAVTKMHETYAQFEEAKIEAEQRLQDTERSLCNAEEDCELRRHIHDDSDRRLQTLLMAYDIFQLSVRKMVEKEATKLRAPSKIPNLEQVITPQLCNFLLDQVHGNPATAGAPEAASQMFGQMLTKYRSENGISQKALSEFIEQFLPEKPEPVDAASAAVAAGDAPVEEPISAADNDLKTAYLVAIERLQEATAQLNAIKDAQTAQEGVTTNGQEVIGSYGDRAEGREHENCPNLDFAYVDDRNPEAPKWNFPPATSWNAEPFGSQLASDGPAEAAPEIEQVAASTDLVSRPAADNLDRTQLLLVSVLPIFALIVTFFSMVFREVRHRIGYKTD